MSATHNSRRFFHSPLLSLSLTSGGTSCLGGGGALNTNMNMYTNTNMNVCTNTNIIHTKKVASLFKIEFCKELCKSVAACAHKVLSIYADF